MMRVMMICMMEEVRRGGGGGRRRREEEEEEEEKDERRVGAKKQEPHTEMWGKKKEHMCEEFHTLKIPTGGAPTFHENAEPLRVVYSMKYFWMFGW